MKILSLLKTIICKSVRAIKQSWIATPFSIFFAFIVISKFPEVYYQVFDLGKNLPYFEYVLALKFNLWYHSLLPKGSWLVMTIVKIWLIIVAIFALPNLIVSLLFKNWKNFASYLVNILAPISTLVVQIAIASSVGSISDLEGNILNGITYLYVFVTIIIILLSIAYKNHLKKNGVTQNTLTTEKSEIPLS